MNKAEGRRNYIYICVYIKNASDLSLLNQILTFYCYYLCVLLFPYLCFQQMTTMKVKKGAILYSFLGW